MSFLSEDEWKKELTILLQDLQDENRNIRRASGLSAHARIALQKVESCIFVDIFTLIGSTRCKRFIPASHPLISETWKWTISLH